MKRISLFILVAALTLAAYPQPVEAAKALDVVLLGGQFSQNGSYLGMTFEGQKKLADGRVAFTVLAATGPAQNAGGLQTGAYLLEGGSFELAAFGGMISEWQGDPTTEGLDNYVRGSSELFAAWNFKGWGIYGKWKRLYPLTDNRLTQDNLYSLGVKINVP